MQSADQKKPKQTRIQRDGSVKQGRDDSIQAQTG